MHSPALVVELHEPEEACLFLAVVAIGLLTEVGNEVMTLAEAERLLFTPRTVRILSDKGLSPALCELIMECCELDDILDLLPLKFDAELRKMINRFSVYLKGSVTQDPYSTHLRLK
ncbi:MULTISPECIES: DUF3969 family protein [unclassified Pseudomonas]|uniref:DUF3969 family protein n=1 Tax=unclassified Pseudomonas TaxID=196821 RepID=UPI001F590AE4|nr:MULTISPECIES: DUF3969 family protein [unclassified Pseudomonas]